MQNDPTVGILIPAYQPDTKLIALVDELQEILKKLSFHLVVINDGSTNSNSKKIFQKLSAGNKITVISHEKNLGKGAALKSGFKFAFENNFEFIVTADADGQHLASDIYKITKKVIREKKFIIGQREFGSEVPFRSKIGNTFTSYLFKIIFGNFLDDTQSGLRAFPTSNVTDYLKINSNGYQFEFEILIMASKRNDIATMPITTVYLERNKTSHFRPILDSSLIYLVFIRYSMLVPFISICDFVTFIILNNFFYANNSFLISRFLTFIIYFLVMKKLIFKSTGGGQKQFVMTSILFIFNLLIIAEILKLVNDKSKVLIVGVYFTASFFMFMFNFLVQKFLIYRTNDSA